MLKKEMEPGGCPPSSPVNDSKMFVSFRGTARHPKCQRRPFTLKRGCAIEMPGTLIRWMRRQGLPGGALKTDEVSIVMKDGGRFSGILALPHWGNRDKGVIFAHGAGNDMNHPLIVFLAESLAHKGFPTLRFNFPYREKGGNRPDPPDVLREAWGGAHRFLAAHLKSPARLIAAGKSLGGRIASHMVAEEKLPVDGLVFLGYPLHAPGRTDSPRDAHLYGIKTPMLFFAGTKDSLCDLGLLQTVLERLTAPWELAVIEGGDHSFNVPKSSSIPQQEIHDTILRKLLEWLEIP